MSWSTCGLPPWSTISRLSVTRPLLPAGLIVCEVVENEPSVGSVPWVWVPTTPEEAENFDDE